ncbi:MAG: glycyl-radical enzyme activating protein [Firmicutes bacterium]|nr:glycyl-radical enzyme activating protein [Bacillota bacterium]
MAKGIIFDIQEFTVHDGPGIRITVFFKGCPLRCVWCHNPEGLSFWPELMVRKASCINCGKCRQGCTHEECRPFGLCTKVCPRGLIKIVGETVDSTELATKLKKREEFLQKNGGGITLSGGEPLAQPEFLVDLLKEIKPMHTVVETSGYGRPDVFLQVVTLTDLILFDIKHTDSGEHKRLTGVDNRLILENLGHLKESGKPFIVRIPLIPGINDTIDNMEKTAMLLKDASNLEKVELLPYNPFTGAKYPMVGKEYRPSFDERQEPRFYTKAFERFNIMCSIL